MTDEYVTRQMLIDFGIEVSDEDAESLLTHLNEKIEEMIGAELTEALTDAELDELMTIQENGTDDEIGDWIASHVLDYEQIVSDNIDIAIDELADKAYSINQAVAFA